MTNLHNTAVDPQRVESLGPAEKIVRALVSWTDHMVHNRPGVVVPAVGTAVGVRWHPATHKDGVLFRLDRVKVKGKSPSTVRVRLGELRDNGDVFHMGRKVGEYRKPGLFPEVARWLYRQVADVWKMDNDFAAHWASWAFAQDHRDLKVVLAAFMLVQTRAGEPVRDAGELLFYDDDFRAVGEAMCLLRRKDGKDLNPRLLLRVGDLLELDVVAAINRELGFGRSARNAPLGRYNKAVTRWLRHRERNPRMLKGLVKAGFRRTVMKLARKVGYKPESELFFVTLGWKQKQASDGRRQMAIGKVLTPAESWVGLSEVEICERIVRDRPSFKRVVGRVPAELGLTRAIVAAAMQAGSISDRELVILTPTLEDLGLLDVPELGERWMKATVAVEDQRAARIAQRVKSKDRASVLQQSSDNALQRSMKEAVRGLRVYVAVDVSASMNQAIDQAKAYLSQFLQGFPLDKLSVCVFNTAAREVVIRHPSAKGVEHAFKGFRAGGGTSHGAAFQVFAKHLPSDDEDAIVLFVGDQQESGTFARYVRQSGMTPVAFGLLYVPGSMGERCQAVQATAAELEIPCFNVDKDMFGDAYAVGRTFRNLISSTPVGQSTVRKARTSLVHTILKTPLLSRPAWA